MLAVGLEEGFYLSQGGRVEDAAWAGHDQGGDGVTMVKLVSS